MPPKAKIPAPIDRPLSRAYLREFTGWSTAFPPGISEPTSLRVMENVMINRDGSLRTRPGLRYLSKTSGGAALPAGRDVVGTHEAFFLNDGSKAYLFAVREADSKVGFRVLKFVGTTGTVYNLTDPTAGFTVPQGESVLNFTSATTYVKYLQIDNKIIALSDAGEEMRLFYVGAEKTARKLTSITEPGWTTADKLTVVHPDDDWIKGSVSSTRTNLILDPSAEGNTSHTTAGANTTRTNVAAHPRTGTRSMQIVATADGSMQLLYNAVEIDSLLTRPYTGSVYVEGAVAGRNVKVGIRWQNSSGTSYGETWGDPVVSNVGNYVRAHVTGSRPSSSATHARLIVEVGGVLAAEEAWVDDALLETGDRLLDYFDGSTPDELNIDYGWTGQTYISSSTAAYSAPPSTIPTQAVPAVNSLVSSDATKNVYNYGFWYTFSNEVGESAASQITAIKARRAWTGWSWREPTTTNEPGTVDTVDPDKAADQLVAYMPQAVFDTALAQGATKWNLYMITWSDQDAVPVEGTLMVSKDLTSSSTRNVDGWARVNPQNILQANDTAPLPSEDSRSNSTEPSSAAQGIVASDRMVLVNDRAAQGQIKWTSNRQGEYINFSSAKGGGYKTLTSGNLYVPACVKLWQNPQSVDTLTVLCIGVDGYSTSYYMSPSQVTSQSDATSFMAFEETTATPGTVSAYGCEVLNNALYHPLDDQLMKSTASNYNINHKMMTELIENMWKGLKSKDLIVSSQLDNRLYYLVHNPLGVALEPGMRGNEVWILDTGKEGGSWSRWLVQGQSLRKIEYDGRIAMSISRPEGIYCFDEDKTTDDVVNASTRAIGTAPIPWAVETNTQGANRAHDAWAHLQQVTITLGNMLGSVEWGVKGWDINGKPIDISKVTTDSGAASADGLPWDREDHLQVRRDMKEWHFYAGSASASGQINLVQYRYTPVSVNVGYEYGSVETFEYQGGGRVPTSNGVPIPAIDLRRP